MNPLFFKCLSKIGIYVGALLCFLGLSFLILHLTVGTVLWAVGEGELVWWNYLLYIGAIVLGCLISVSSRRLGGGNAKEGKGGCEDG